ncbi:MAG: catalase family protein [Hyphomicrobiales bacterium]|nr:catalase family protein [Hyphomicrobiales bacterium]
MRASILSAAVFFTLAFNPAHAQNSSSSSFVPGREQEVIEPDEAASIAEIQRLSIERLKRQFPEGKRPVLRDAHPKAHGLVSAEFIVLDGLPEELRHGVFAKPGTYQALIRFSAGNVEVQEDTIPQAAGMAIKLLGVEGKKLLQREADAKTQDFVMINAPVFFVSNLKDYVGIHEALDAGRLLDFFQARPRLLEAIMIVRGQVLNNPVQVRYWSMTPYLLGERAVKFSATPLSHTANEPPAELGPDFKRESMIRQVSSEDVYYEFGIQLQADPKSMPVEDPVVQWDEKVSPFQRVALIRIPKQDITADSWVQFGENLSFTPWHSLSEHRPLGSNNRARLPIYEAISDFRRETNGVTVSEPTTIPER